MAGNVSTNGRSTTLDIAITPAGQATLFELRSAEKPLWRDWGCFDNPERRTEYLEQIAQRFTAQHSAWKSGNVLQRLASALTQYEKDQQESSLPRIISAGELFETAGPMREPVIDGLLRRGEIANIISESKIGKSWLSLSLLFSIVTGRDWLDTFPVTQGRVLLIDNELHKPTILARMKTVADAMGIHHDEYRDMFGILSLRGNLKSFVDIETVIGDIEPSYYTSVVVDAFYRMLPKDTSENDNAEMAAVYNLIDRYAEQTQASWQLIHHSTKGSQAEKRITDVGAGAGSQSRAVDCHLVLRQHSEENHVVLDASVRSFPPVEPIVLRWGYPCWTKAANVDPRKLRRRITATEEKQAALDAEGIAKIIATLAQHQTGTERKIRGWTGLSRDRCERLLNQLSATERLVFDEITVRGNPCNEYRLAPPKGDVVDG